MPLERLTADLNMQLAELEQAGTAKGREAVVGEVRRPQGARGPRFLLDGHGQREFIRMNSNSYLGLSLRAELLLAEERAAEKYGVGPGAVGFMSGPYQPHVLLERALAAFHDRDACMLSGAAYTGVMGVLASLTTPDTILVSDELNHNCIVNGMKLARPKARKVYAHLDLGVLEEELIESVGQGDGLIVITDGVFSMRGDHAPIDRLRKLIERFDARFPRGAVLLVDDSHGVGAFGETGRGSEEVTGGRADILVGTLGKAFGVNGGGGGGGGTGGRPPRAKNPLSIYPQPLPPGAAAAALGARALVPGASRAALLSPPLALARR